MWKREGEITRMTERDRDSETEIVRQRGTERERVKSTKIK